MQVRFYDMLMRSQNISQAFKNELKNALVIEASNVAEYYWSGSDQEVWTIEKDFPNLAPPFPKFFIECKAPSKIVSEKYGELPWYDFMPRYWGLLCTGVDTSKIEIPTFATSEEQEQFMQDTIRRRGTQLQLISTFIDELHSRYGSTVMLEDIAGELPPMQRAALAEYNGLEVMYKLAQAGDWEKIRERLVEARSAYRWVMDMQIVLDIGDGIWGPLWQWHVLIKDDGSVAYDESTKLPQVNSRPLGDLERTAYEMIHDKDTGSIDALETMHDQCKPYADCAFLAISFLHCKNVVLDKVTPARHVVRNKSAKRRGEKDFQPVTYHTLDIRPMKAILEKEGGASPSGNGTARALHICRGHFRHYKDGRGLFGRPQGGTYWVAQHVRGGATEQIAVKDYNIKL